MISLMKQQRRMSGAQTILLVVSVVILSSTLCASVFVQRPVRLFHWQDFRHGNYAVKRIEAFRTEKGRLPDSLEEAGVKDLSFQFFYQKVDAQNYELSFPLFLGESEVYESSTKRWK